jgi:hypothetical protein
MLITDCVHGCSVLRLNLDRPQPVRELTQDGSKAGAFFVKAEPEGCFLLRQWQGRLWFSHSDPRARERRHRLPPDGRDQHIERAG